MAGRIPQEFIAQVLAQTDIVELIGAQVPLRKAGRNYVGLCPFHGEKTPSFTVSREKQFYYCFGCGASGNAIGFLVDHAGMEFLVALEDLAGRLGLQVPRSAADGERRALDPLYQVMEQASEFYQRQLQDAQHGEAARAYLQERGISEAISAEYELGYALPGWEYLCAALGRDEKSRKVLEQAGLAVRHEQRGHYDRFRNRLMFPIRQRHRGVLGFGARTLTDEEPKYLNSPQTPIFNKGGTLYGLHQVLQRGTPEQLYIVEGYMDVLVLAQHQIGNVVATLGTATTAAHLQILFRHCSRLILCFDGDAAGRQAAQRVMEISLPLLNPERKLEFMFLPEGEDPDSFVRSQGRDHFEAASLRISFSDFLLRQVREGGDELSSLEGRSQLLERAIPYLQPMGDHLLRRLILQELAPSIGVEVEYLEQLLQERRQESIRTVLPELRRRGQQRPSDLPEPSLLGRMISLLLQRPALAEIVEDPRSLIDLQIEGIEFLVELLELIHGQPTIGCAAILEHWRNTRYEQRMQQLASEWMLLGEPGNLEQEFQDALARLRQRHLRGRFRKLAEELGQASDPSMQKEKLRSLQQAFVESSEAFEDKS